MTLFQKEVQIWVDLNWDSVSAASSAVGHKLGWEIIAVSTEDRVPRKLGVSE